jgi:U32 family peptidase
MNQASFHNSLRRPELLAPGGSFDKCRIAFLYGADAVYAAGKDFGLRGFAHNLDTEELAAAAFLARRLGKKLYVTVNVFAREHELSKIPAYLEYLAEIGVDALIVSDPGVLMLARKYAPEIPTHLSTQANTTNSLSVEFWKNQGVSRINLARELTYTELSEIAQRAAIELEVFVHGAMCMSYSGRCLMSAFLNNRSANSGFCTQPCRWSYRLVEEKRPGEYFPVQEDSRGTYIFNSKDLCLIQEIGTLASLGIDSFKIEGRMKGALYLASVTRAYRRAVDAYLEKPDRFQAEPDWLDDLLKVSHRPYTKGMLYGGADSCSSGIETSVSYIQTHTLAGLVRMPPSSDLSADDGAGGFKIHFETRSRLVPGTRLEFLYPDGTSRVHDLHSFEDMNGNSLSEAHPNRWIRFSTEFPVFPCQVVRIAKNHHGNPS